MSMTRILCPVCGFPQAFCACGNMDHRASFLTLRSETARPEQRSTSNSTPANMQCKDIPDAPILRFLDGLNCRWATWFDYEPRPENTVLRAMPPGTPPKLALAKMRVMIRRKIVDGCPCGCRGDFVITESGKALLLSLQNNQDQTAAEGGSRKDKK